MRGEAADKPHNRADVMTSLCHLPVESSFIGRSLSQLHHAHTHDAHRADHQLIGCLLLLVAQGRVERIDGRLQFAERLQMCRHGLLAAGELLREACPTAASWIASWAS